MVDTRANYGGTIPEYYDRCLGPAWFDAFGADLARRLPDPSAGDVLEIACGTGLVSFAAAEQVGAGGEVVGVDISGQMVELARRRSAARGAANVAFARASYKVVAPDAPIED